MKTIISNDIKVYEPTQDVIMWAKNNLIVDNPIYKQMKFMGKEDVIKYKHIPEKLYLYSDSRGALIMPFGVLRSIWSLISNDNYELKFNSNADLSVPKTAVPTFPPFKYQEKAINFMVKSKGGVLVAPCGSGKTYMGIEIIRRIGKKTLWLCHTSDLLRQAADDMKLLYPNIKIGFTTEGKLEIGEDVTISTVQTLDNIDPNLYGDCFDVVICDECAHVASTPTQSKMFGRILSNIAARYKYGLTATPDRADGLIKAMYSCIGTSVDGLFEPTYKIDRSEVKAITAIHEKIDIYSGYDNEKMTELYDTSGMTDYNLLISTLSSNEERTNKIIDNVVKCNDMGRKQIVLTLRVEHCKDILDKLQKRGVNAVLCVGKVSKKERKAIIKQEIKWDVIVATYSLLKEGISINELDTLHLATPIKDRSMIVQCAGRIERYMENKNQPIIYDYVDTDIPGCEKKYTERRRALKRRF